MLKHQYKQPRDREEADYERGSRELGSVNRKLIGLSRLKDNNVPVPPLQVIWRGWQTTTLALETKRGMRGGLRMGPEWEMNARCVDGERALGDGSDDEEGDGYEGSESGLHCRCMGTGGHSLWKRKKAAMVVREPQSDFIRPPGITTLFMSPNISAPSAAVVSTAPAVSPALLDNIQCTPHSDGSPVRPQDCPRATLAFRRGWRTRHSNVSVSTR